MVVFVGESWNTRAELVIKVGGAIFDIECPDNFLSLPDVHCSVKADFGVVEFTVPQAEYEFLIRRFGCKFVHSIFDVLLFFDNAVHKDVMTPFRAVVSSEKVEFFFQIQVKRENL